MVADREEGVVLYGAPASLYTAKVRACLRASGVPFVERFPSHPRYREVIRPAVETHRIPVVEFADGEIVQDSTVILDRLQARFPDAAGPTLGPRQTLLTHLLESLADRGFSKPAMHFRWSFPDLNEAFLLGEFGRALLFPGPPAEIERLGRRVADKMAGYLPMLGIDARSIPTIERAYAEGLAMLNAHFGEHPYLLGGAPTRGDYAMMGPLYGHLGRDPYPLQLMQRTAPLIYRWTERINGAERLTPEFPDRPRTVLADDGAPESLVAWMRHLLRGYGSELVQTAERFNAWVDQRPDAPPGALLSPEGADQPPLGPIVTDYHGLQIEQQALGHSLWILQRALDHMAALEGEALAACRTLVRGLGAEEVMAIRLKRRLTRVRNRLAVA